MKSRWRAWSVYGSDDRAERPGLGAALRFHYTARRGKPTAADRPPVSTFPGRKATVVSGQLDIEGRVHVPQARSSMMRPNG